MKEFIYDCFFNKELSSEEIVALLESKGVSKEEATKMIDEEVDSYLKQKKKKGILKIVIGILMVVVTPLAFFFFWTLTYNGDVIFNRKIMRWVYFVAPFLIMIYGIYYIEKGRDLLEEVKNGEF